MCLNEQCGKKNVPPLLSYFLQAENVFLLVQYYDHVSFTILIAISLLPSCCNAAFAFSGYAYTVSCFASTSLTTTNPTRHVAVH